VLSTLHGGDVATVIARLLEMGLEPYVVTSALRAVLAMRLVRRLCERCRPLPSGCDACGHTGYAGRLPLVEFAEITGGLKKLILACGDSDAFAQELARGGMRTLAAHGIELVGEGRTSLAELTRVLGPLEKQA
jgi:general secretion pathway protein E